MNNNYIGYDDNSAGGNEHKYDDDFNGNDYNNGEIDQRTFH